MHNSVAKKIFAVGLATSTALMAFAPFAAHAAAHAAGTNVKSSDGTVWMVTSDGMRRPYTSAGAFLSYGFNSFASVVSASAEDLALSAGAFIPPQDGSIICSDRGTDKGTCYLITGSQKAGFTSAAVFTGRGFSFSNSKFGDVSWMNSTSNINETTTAHRPGVLVNNHGTVYLMGPTGLLGIPDLATFNSWGYSFANVVPANAVDAAMTQTGVMAMRIAGQLNPTALTGGSNNPPVVSGSVSASLSSDTPASGTVVAGQAIADLAHFTFNGNGTVTQVVLKRIGVSADATLSNVYLYNGNNKITDAGSVSNGNVTFSNSNGLFSVNGSATISVKSDILCGGSPCTTSGQTVGVQLSSFTVANGSPVSTSFSGNTMTVASATLAGVTLNATSTIGTTVNAGTMNSTLWSGNFTVSTRSVSLKYLALRMIGSAPSDALQNLQLYVAGNPVGSKVSIGSDNRVVFDLSGSPVTMQTGNNVIEVRGDVVKGSSRTFSLQLQTASDMVVVDSSYGVNISVSAGSFSFPVTMSPNSTTINQGSVSIQTDPSFTTTQVVKNASNVTLGQWTLKAYGEDVKVQTLGVNVNYNVLPAATEGFNNLTLYVNGAAVGSSQSAISPSATSTTYTFGTTNLFTIPAGTSVTVAVKGDMTLLSSTSVTSVTASLVVNANSQQGVTSFNTFPTGSTTYTGTALTIASSSVTLAKNSGYSNQTIASNTSNQKIGSFSIQASNAEDVRITSLTVALSGTMGSTATNLANLYIKTPSTSATPINPSSSNNFSVDFTVPANQTATVDVYADITNATGTVITTLNGSGTGKSSGQSVTLSATTGQTITVGNGTLNTPTLTSASPVAQFIVGGATNQAVGTFNFTSTNGGSTIKEMTFWISGSNVPTDTPITSVMVGGQVGTVVGTSTTVTGLNIVVPAGFSGVDVPVTVNIASAGFGGITSNKTAILTLKSVKYLSGSVTTTNTVSVPANTMTVVATKPTVALAAANTTLSTGTVKIGSVTVSADAGGNVVLRTLPITVSASGGATVSSSANNILVKDASSNSTITTTNSGLAVASGSSGSDTITFSSGYTIAAGTSKTFDIYVTVSGTLTTGASVSLSLGSAASFTWDDVAGNATSITGSAIYNYPSSSVSIHN